MGREAKSVVAVEYLPLTVDEINECKRKAMSRVGKPITEKYPGAEGVRRALLVDRSFRWRCADVTGAALRVARLHRVGWRLHRRPLPPYLLEGRP